MVSISHVEYTCWQFDDIRLYSQSDRCGNCPKRGNFYQYLGVLPSWCTGYSNHIGDRRCLVEHCSLTRCFEWGRHAQLTQSLRSFDIFPFLQKARFYQIYRLYRQFNFVGTMILFCRQHNLHNMCLISRFWHIRASRKSVILFAILGIVFYSTGVAHRAIVFLSSPLAQTRFGKTRRPRADGDGRGLRGRRFAR